MAYEAATGPLGTADHGIAFAGVGAGVAEVMEREGMASKLAGDERAGRAGEAGRFGDEALGVSAGAEEREEGAELPEREGPEASAVAQMREDGIVSREAGHAPPSVPRSSRPFWSRRRTH